MPNYFWYLALAVIGLGLFLYTLLKAKFQKVFILYLFIAGGIYFFEYFILVLLNSYVYHPSILDNSYFDNILGSVVSNGFIVPMSSVFIVVFKLKAIFLYLIATTITGIQFLFLYLGIYEDHWWNLIYTWFGLVLAFKVSKLWFIQLNQSPGRFIRFITLFFASLLIAGSAVFVLVAFFNKYFYNLNWFANDTRSHVAFATLHIILISLILTTLVIFKTKWYMVIISLILFQYVDYLLLQYGYLTLNNWPLEYFFILRVAYYLSLLSINKYLVSEPIP